MKSKLTAILGMLAGSFLIYCGESAINKAVGDHSGDASFTKDAKAQPSCNGSCGAPAFTKLWEGDLKPGNSSTPTVQVGSYREVLLYAISGGGTCGIDTKFRFDASSPYATFYGASSGVVRFPILGNEMMLVGGTSGNNPCTGDWTYHVIVVGVL